MAREEKLNLIERSPNAISGSGTESPIRHLLIVDDNELTCQQLQKVLQGNSGLRVDFSTNGNQALQLLEEANYSILVTDLCMPELSGMDLIRRIQERGLP